MFPHSYTECYSAGLWEEQDKDTHTWTRRPALGFSSVYPNTCCRLYLRHQQNWHWTMFLKRYASRYFLKNLWCVNRWAHQVEVRWAARERHREDVDGGHLPKHTHSQSTLTHTRSQNPQDRPLKSRMWLQHISVASVLGSYKGCVQVLCPAISYASTRKLVPITHDKERKTTVIFLSAKKSIRLQFL